MTFVAVFRRAPGPITGYRAANGEQELVTTSLSGRPHRESVVEVEEL
jgi:hypothetical protein